MRSKSSICLLGLIGLALRSFAAVPQEPMEIGAEPQFFVDDYVVDNRWSLKPKTEEVVRVFHPAKKDKRNPLIVGGCGYASVVHEADTGVFKMWYQTHIRGADDDKSQYGIAYAESKDGLAWTRPELGLYEWKGTKANNIVWRGSADFRASGQQILQLPADARRGGVICTRQIHWPGGKLLVNADAHAGELKVRVSGDRRKPLPGFDYSDCQPFTGDSVAHEVKWGGKSADELKGQVIRLEFQLKDADLYTFRAAPGK